MHSWSIDSHIGNYEQKDFKIVTLDLVLSDAYSYWIFSFYAQLLVLCICSLVTMTTEIAAKSISVLHHPVMLEFRGKKTILAVYL